MVSPAPRHRYTLEDYLGVEEMSRVKHEFLDGEIVAMAGGTPEHAALSAAVIVILGQKLRAPCRPYSSNLRLHIPASRVYTYPDAAVVCGEPARASMSPTHVTNPTVIVEVLSPSTEDYDRGEKREQYQTLESLREYVLVAVDRRRIEVYARSVAGEWSHRAHDAGSDVELPSVDCVFGVNDLYAAAGLYSPD